MIHVGGARHTAFSEKSGEAPKNCSSPRWDASGSTGKFFPRKNSTIDVSIANIHIQTEYGIVHLRGRRPPRSRTEEGHACPEIAVMP